MITKQICTDGSNSPDIYWGLSTDTKPTENIKNPSFFKEKDTSKEYVFNEDSGEWVEIETGGGGDTNHLYRHNLTIQTTSGSFYALASIYNADNSSINSFKLLLDYLADGRKHEAVSGYFGSPSSGEDYKGFLYSMEWNGTKIRMLGIDVSTKQLWIGDYTSNSGVMVQDAVTNIF